MSERAYLGEFEQIVLLALVRLAPSAYGVVVRQEIERRTGRETSIGAIYATLDRLEQKGLVQSSLGDPTPERGGRAKRLFVVTTLGSEALSRSRTALLRMMDGIEGTV